MAGDAKEMPSDLSEFCRVCLQLPQASQYLDLSTIYDEEDHLTYSDCFTICTQIDLKAGIGVPHHLCKSCGLELQMSYDFHKKVEESKRVIEKYEKKMQDGTNEQQLLYKPLPQKVVQKNQQQDTNEQELNDATTFFLSPMVVEGNNLPHSQKTLDLTQDEQEYLGSSDEENGVELLSKIGSIRDTVADDQENEHLVPMADCIEIEEHLEMEDFQNLETLEEEESFPKTVHVVKQEFIEDEAIKEKFPDNMQAISHFKTTHDIQMEPIEIKEEIIQEDEIMEVTDEDVPSQAESKNLSDTWPIKCDECGHSFFLHKTLKQHQKRKHCLQEPLVKKSLISKIYPCLCELCGHPFKTKTAFYKHRSIKHPDNNTTVKSKYDITQIISNRIEELKIEIKNECDYTHKCDSNQTLTIFQGLQFLCELCGHSFVNENSLCQHRLGKHTESIMEMIDKDQAKTDTI